jgi:hypothetical protein
MLLDHITLHVMKMTIVKIVGVALVLDGCVAAGRPMLMVVVLVVLVSVCHDSFPS